MKKATAWAFAGIACLMNASTVLAKPISYPGGTTVMTMNTGDMNGLSIIYSPSSTYSYEYSAEYMRDDEYVLQTVQFNYLLKRWNNPDSQGNLYLEMGVGAAYSDAGAFDHETEPAILAGVQADWEDRRYYVSYQNRYTEAGDIDSYFSQSARVGIAPYIGEYGDLHTWLMLEAEHRPEDEDNVTVTPLVRLFKGTHLAEAGVSNKGEVLFHYMFQF